MYPEASSVMLDASSIAKSLDASVSGRAGLCAQKGPRISISSSACRTIIVPVCLGADTLSIMIVAGQTDACEVNKSRQHDQRVQAKLAQCSSKNQV